MSITINNLNIQELLIFVLLTVVFTEGKTPPAWENPDIGLTVDAVADANDATGWWKSQGLSIRAAELIVSANIDPYAFLLSNILISQHGAELHEAFADFHSLPLNLKLRGGLMLANFGRWNRFHTHALPFVSEPRIYREYAGGMLALRGIELSWLVPVSHYIEITASVYNLLEGHTHDVDPQGNSQDLTADKIAEMIGAIPHGSHYDYKGLHIYNEDDLYTIAGLPSPNDPIIYRGPRQPQDFAYGSRITSSLEFGTSLSVDFGTSVIYQRLWKESQRTENGFPRFYDKFLYGADIVFFWHPLSTNRYRNLQTGIEMLGSGETFENLSPSPQIVKGWRNGFTAHVDYMHSQKWHLGFFGSLFQSNDLNRKTKKHAGGYVTFTISHYQYLRFEYSYYKYPAILDGINRIMLQYDASIGYHTHGRQR